jgi:hypothetical protein
LRIHSDADALPSWIDASCFPKIDPIVGPMREAREALSGWRFKAAFEKPESMRIPFLW